MGRIHRGTDPDNPPGRLQPKRPSHYRPAKGASTSQMSTWEVYNVVHLPVDED